MDSIEERIVELLQQAARLAAYPESGRDVPRREFPKWRERVSRLLLVTVGPAHALYQEFLTTVTAPTRPAIEASIPILRGVLRLYSQVLETDLRFEHLLHETIREHAYEQFRIGHYRDAVFNSIVAVFDLLRDRTGLQLDGAALATQAFSVAKPHIVVGDISTENGRNEQVGFMMMLQGAYSAVRNPKAHTLRQETPSVVAAQYLVFASLLARRISEASIPSAPP